MEEINYESAITNIKSTLSICDIIKFEVLKTIEKKY